MRRPGLAPLVVVALLTAACTDNSAPGNDREAQVSPPEPPAEVASVGAAIKGVDTGTLIPQAMTDGDLGNVPDLRERCLFRFTRVGLPVFIYGETGVMKLNGKLASLPGTGEGEFAADGLTVTVRPLEDDPTEGEPFIAELVLHLPDKDHELGYHGFSECDSALLPR